MIKIDVLVNNSLMVKLPCNVLLSMYPISVAILQNTFISSYMSNLVYIKYI